jgi:peptide/nickel transport system permease protein
MGRFGFVARRLVQVVPILAGVVLVVFLLLHVAPGDPARNVAGLRASDDEIAQVRTDLGIDRPLPVQYLDYLASAASGDLGYSYKSREPVTTMIGERIEVTVWLLAAGLGTALAAAVPLAVLAARKQGTLVDELIRLACLAGIGMPAFWVGAMLLLAFALKIDAFPAGGFGETTTDHLRSVVLPGLALALGTAPILIRSLRAAILTTLGHDYVATARSLGLPEGTVLRRFVLRNAAPSAITLLALEVGYLLFGAVVIESTFALPGVGQGLVLAARGRDLPAIQGYTLLFALVVIAANLLADVAHVLLDPRVQVDT